MKSLTREEIVSALGPVDDCIIAEIIAMDLTPDELAEAQAWVTNDEAMMNSGRPLATGRVGHVVELLALSDEDQEAEFQSGLS
ncbi:MAG: hypothetical protein HY659_12035 [Rhizobiales bacterium]|nr:hypothetical protein [Hyphomicrobiales bacterium]